MERQMLPCVELRQSFVFPSNVHYTVDIRQLARNTREPPDDFAIHKYDCLFDVSASSLLTSRLQFGRSAERPLLVRTPLHEAAITEHENKGSDQWLTSRVNCRPCTAGEFRSSRLVSRVFSEQAGKFNPL